MLAISVSRSRVPRLLDFNFPNILNLIPPLGWMGSPMAFHVTSHVFLVKDTSLIVWDDDASLDSFIER